MKLQPPIVEIVSPSQMSFSQAQILKIIFTPSQEGPSQAIVVSTLTASIEFINLKDQTTSPHEKNTE